MLVALVTTQAPSVLLVAFAVMVEPAQKKTKIDEPGKLLTFVVAGPGGMEVNVSLPCTSTVADLEEKVGRQLGLGFCFSLLREDLQPLTDLSAPLPNNGSKLRCITEPVYSLKNSGPL